MRITSFLCTLMLLSSAAASARAADLTKIDRTIGKEPAYKNKPKYCLLVFGPEAKTRIWLVQDGDVLYVDRNGNGDLTEKDERLKEERHHPQVEFPAVSFSLPGDAGPKGQLQLSVHYYKEEGDTKETPHPGVTVGIDRKHWRAPCRPFSDHPRDAPVLHFDGPDTFLCPHLRFFEPGKKTNLAIYTGTPGLGERTYAWRNARQIIGAGGRVKVEIEFPHKDPAAEPIRTVFTLPLEDDWGSTFAGSVSVPEEAGPGMAKMSLRPWPQEANLAPATFLVPVVGAEPLRVNK
jgi:hypothetical protein